MTSGFRAFDKDGNELSITAGPSYSVGIRRDDNGNLAVYENGELVTDETRAVELYGRLGGAIGWSIMDAADESAA